MPLRQKLKTNLHISNLQGFMFFAMATNHNCNGNHQFKAWIGYILRLLKNDRDWYISVDSIYSDTKGKIGLLLNAIYNLNK
jgi:hypothetical protein